jgi:hypothetical protein
MQRRGGAKDAALTQVSLYAQPIAGSGALISSAYRRAPGMFSSLHRARFVPLAGTVEHRQQNIMQMK